MRAAPRTAVLTLLALAASGLVAGRADASGFAAPKGARVDQRSVEIARARGGGRTTTWWRARFSAPDGIVVWLVPARGPAAVDVASEAWLDALDDATAPRVVPPRATPPCTMPLAPEVVDLPAAASPRPASGARAFTVAADLEAFLAGVGVEAPPATLTAARAELARGRVVVAVTITARGADESTPTVRIVQDGDDGELPLGLVRASTSPVSLTTWSLADRATRFGDLAPLSLSSSFVTWPRGADSYRAARASLLAGAPDAFLVEAAGHGLLFDGTSIPGGTRAPSAVERYFGLATSIGDAPSGCGAGPTAASWSGRFVVAGTACPAGSLARVGAPACAAAPGDLDPRLVACGVADDLAIALSGTRPAEMGLTRGAAVIAAAGPDPILSGGTGSVTPVVEAGRYDVVCGSSSGGGGSSGLTPPPPSNGGAVEGEVLVATNDGCGGSGGTVYVPADDGSTDDSSDSCGSDGTTASDDSSDDGCGASTDSSSSSSDDSSSDDSSSDDSSSDDSSSDDSSSDDSSSKDDSCSKSSSSSSSSGSSDLVKTKATKAKLKATKAKPLGARAKGKRSPVSRAVLLLALLALPLRRAGRRDPR